jgi:acetylornithine deacetylase
VNQDASKQTLIELLDRLVAFDTTSHKTNVPLIGFVADYLAGFGVEVRMIPNEAGDKINLCATIGPKDTAGGIGLSGHTDVVPVVGQDWQTDPFRLTAKDGRLYGRGTTDMKGYLACVLASVPMFQARQLSRPVHIFFSYDEEIGCVGVRPMIDQLGRQLPMPDIVVVGEPTGMRVVDAHKGPARWNVNVTGRAAHSSMAHLGVNAISAASGLIGELRRIEDDLRQTSRDARFDPPYSTLQVTTIEGGAANNIIPRSCRLGFEVRALPSLDITTVSRRVQDYVDSTCLPPMRAVAEEAAIDIELVNWVPPFAATTGSAAVALALRLAGDNHTEAVSYTTEAGLFQSAGAAAVVCGPGHIAQAHTADEWIAEDELHRCMAFLERLADWAT